MPLQLPALFLADSRGLDFLNSIATPGDVPVDWIGDGAGLLAWLEQAQLVPQEVLAAMREQATAAQFDQVASEARTLREWFRTFVRAHRGKPLKAVDLKELEPLNRLLERDEGFGRIVAHKHGKTTTLQFQRTRRWKAPAALLLPIAEALAKLITEENFADIRACEGPVCTLLFADHTRGRSRRWCSMGLCGNRAKQTAHRQRLKGKS